MFLARNIPATSPKAFYDPIPVPHFEASPRLQPHLAPSSVGLDYFAQFVGLLGCQEAPKHIQRFSWPNM